MAVDKLIFYNKCSEFSELKKVKKKLDNVFIVQNLQKYMKYLYKMKNEF